MLLVSCFIRLFVALTLIYPNCPWPKTHQNRPPTHLQDENHWCVGIFSSLLDRTVISLCLVSGHDVWILTLSYFITFFHFYCESIIVLGAMSLSCWILFWKMTSGFHHFYCSWALLRTVRESLLIGDHDCVYVQVKQKCIA